jgi:hypothetical protein
MPVVQALGGCTEENDRVKEREATAAMATATAWA